MDLNFKFWNHSRHFFRTFLELRYSSTKPLCVFHSFFYVAEFRSCYNCPAFADSLLFEVTDATRFSKLKIINANFSMYQLIWRDEFIEPLRCSLICLKLQFHCTWWFLLNISMIYYIIYDTIRSVSTLDTCARWTVFLKHSIKTEKPFLISGRTCASLWKIKPAAYVHTFCLLLLT